MYFFVFIGENKLTYLLKKIFLRIDSGGATNLIKLLTLENWTVKITSTFGPIWYFKSNYPSPPDQSCRQPFLAKS